MQKYGQFCPVAKASEILGDPWSILIIREMLLGSSRFNGFQRGLPRISPTVLNTRLKDLEACGVLVKRPINGQRGHDYRLTPAGRELSSVVDALAVWGMRWARDGVWNMVVDLQQGRGGSLLSGSGQRCQRLHHLAIPRSDRSLDGGCSCVLCAQRRTRKAARGKRYLQALYQMVPTFRSSRDTAPGGKRAGVDRKEAL